MDLMKSNKVSKIKKTNEKFQLNPNYEHSEYRLLRNLQGDKRLIPLMERVNSGKQSLRLNLGQLESQQSQPEFVIESTFEYGSEMQSSFNDAHKTSFRHTKAETDRNDRSNTTLNKAVA